MLNYLADVGIARTLGLPPAIQGQWQAGLQLWLQRFMTSTDLGGLDPKKKAFRTKIRQPRRLRACGQNRQTKQAFVSNAEWS